MKNMTLARISKAPTPALILMPAIAPVDRGDADVDVDVGVEVDKAVEAGEADTEVDKVEDAVVVALGIDVSDACHRISIPYALKFGTPVDVESDSCAVKINVLVAVPPYVQSSVEYHGQAVASGWQLYALPRSTPVNKKCDNIIHIGEMAYLGQHVALLSITVPMLTTFEQAIE